MYAIIYRVSNASPWKAGSEFYRWHEVAQAKRDAMIVDYQFEDARIVFLDVQDFHDALASALSEMEEI